MNLLNSYLFLLSAFSSYNIQTTKAERPPFPIVRFTKTWNKLTRKQKVAAKILDYEQSTWDYPETDNAASWDMEVAAFKKKFRKLSKKSRKALEGVIGFRPKNAEEAFTELAKVIGFDKTAEYTVEEMWDCWHDHYSSYSWDELKEEEVVEYYEALGWTQNVWDGGKIEKPESENTYWVSLDDVEKAAASNLCFTQKLWDNEEPLPIIR